MKKLGIFFVAVLLCVAGWAGATYVVGGRVEKRYFDLLEENARWGPLTLSNQSYQRGLLCSRATTLLEMTVPVDPEEDAGENQEPEFQTMQVVFAHTLHHGPVPLAEGPDGGRSLTPALALVETRLVRISPVEDDLEELLDEIPELQESVSRVRVAFDGKANGRLRVPAFEKEDGDARIRFAGAEATTKYDPLGGSLVGAIDMPRMEIRVEDSAMSWNGVNARFDMVEVLPMLYVGKSVMVFGGMDMDLPGRAGGGREAFRLKKFEVVSDSSFDEGMVRVVQVVRFEGGAFDGKSFGPLIVDVEAKNLDGEVLSEFQGQVREVYRNVASADPDALAAGVVPLYADLFTRLVRADPELNLRKFYVDTPVGEAEGTVRVKITGIPEARLNGPIDPKEFLRHLDSAVDVSVDESLIRALLASNVKQGLKGSREAARFSEEEIDALVDRQMESRLEMLAARNFIVRQAGRVKTRATLHRGELVVNGRPVPVFEDRP